MAASFSTGFIHRCIHRPFFSFFFYTLAENLNEACFLFVRVLRLHRMKAKTKALSVFGWFFFVGVHNSFVCAHIHGGDMR